MRLINTATLELKEFLGEPNNPQFPRYAILSHTWGEGEVTFQEMQNIEIARKKEGYDKIAMCCKTALKEGLCWAWVDTCCIDKTSSAELSEAINSMFKWYEYSTICYAYLSDVGVSSSDIQQPPAKLYWQMSRWFTRGWTLQELIAPYEVIIYDRQWKQLGTKRRLALKLEEKTYIPKEVLLNPSCRCSYTVIARMSWAMGRETTRVEDEAYSLLGLFDINMPLLYGEGNKAMSRLHQEILSIIDDDTIFLGALSPTDILSGWFSDSIKQAESNFLVNPVNIFDKSLTKIRPLPASSDWVVSAQWHPSKMQCNDPRKDPKMRGDVVSMPMRIIQITFPNCPSSIPITMNKQFYIEPDSMEQMMVRDHIESLRASNKSFCLAMLRCEKEGQIVARYFECVLVNGELVADPLPVYRLVSPETVFNWPYMQCHISHKRSAPGRVSQLWPLRDPANWGSRRDFSTIIFGNGWTLDPVSFSSDPDTSWEHNTYTYKLHLERSDDTWHLTLTYEQPYTVKIILQRQQCDAQCSAVEAEVIDSHNEREGQVTELCHRMPVRGGSAELIVSVYHEISKHRHSYSPMIRFRAFEQL
ncbi:heterokaryon incompatibility protein-domain-containing protein [Xylaria arbuscula]|nr:heterokaryon incompatibility protein-domain-containing protein [Xylaria arbuscula]